MGRNAGKVRLFTPIGLARELCSLQCSDALFEQTFFIITVHFIYAIDSVYIRITNCFGRSERELALFFMHVFIALAIETVHVNSINRRLRPSSFSW